MRSRAIHRWNSKTAFTLASFFCLFLFGLFDSLKGSTLSTLLKDLNLNYSLGERMAPIPDMADSIFK